MNGVSPRPYRFQFSHRPAAVPAGGAELDERPAEQFKPAAVGTRYSPGQCMFGFHAHVSVSWPRPVATRYGAIGGFQRIFAGSQRLVLPSAAGRLFRWQRPCKGARNAAFMRVLSTLSQMNTDRTKDSWIAGWLANRPASINPGLVSWPAESCLTPHASRSP